MLKKIILSSALLSLSANVSAAVITSVFDSSWTDITTQPTSSGSPEDTSGDASVYVNPGWGGQAFDAEYLFYKLEGNMLSIGLQTGFDIMDGVQDHNGLYYAGDIALSFNGATAGDSSSYEYAIDFGFYTADYYGGNTGTQNAGLYTVSNWNNEIYFDGPGGHTNSGDSKDSSAPFSMSAGTELSNVDFSHSSGSATVNGELSYFQIATFDVSDLGLTQLDLDAHWTMSCGNDAVDGHVVTAVPEPSSLLLLSAGFMGLMGSLLARRKKQLS